MMGETLPGMALLEVVAFAYHCLLKAGKSIPSAAIIYFFNISISGIYVQFEILF